MSVDKVVETATAVKQSGTIFAGFNKVAILSDTDTISTVERFRKYASLEELADDFESTTIEYKKASSLFDQVVKPSEVFIVRISIATDDEDALVVLNDFVSKGGGSYFLGTTVTNEDNIIEIADAVEKLTTKMHFVALTNDTDVLDSSSTDDLASKFNDKDYRRSSIVFHHNSTTYADMNLLGRIYITNEGESWENRLIKGVVPSRLSSTQIATLESKNCGYFIEIDGDTWSKGIMNSLGWYADVNRGIDYIDQAIDSGIINLFRDNDMPKNEATLAQIKAVINDVLYDGVDKNIVVEESIIINMPSANDLPKGRDIELKNLYEYDYLHSIHKIKIIGTVTI